MVSIKGSGLNFRTILVANGTMFSRLGKSEQPRDVRQRQGRVVQS